MPTISSAPPTPTTTSAVVSNSHTTTPGFIVPLSIIGAIAGTSTLALVGITLCRRFLTLDEIELEGEDDPSSEMGSSKTANLDTVLIRRDQEADLKSAVALPTLEKCDPLASSVYGDVPQIPEALELADHFPFDVYNQYRVTPFDQFALGPYDRIALSSYPDYLLPTRRAPVFNRTTGAVTYPMDDTPSPVSPGRQHDGGESGLPRTFPLPVPAVPYRSPLTGYF
ncbi:hypothetical protein HGRIS_000395 [Hohenbuehelia grisea]|uniref:Uncharacterized protein n=1 Tax=Hohenbuehelia grisea TaxID=104357 RepID=A0ABR3JRJ6_9AGAR